MSKQFSEFTLNFNGGARANDKAPTMKGKTKVIVDGVASEFDAAAWGPNQAQSGGPDFYNLTLTPKDPALAARQLKTEFVEGDIPNAIEGFELKKLGTGRMFERSAEELSAGKDAGKNLPKFYGHALVLLPSGPRYIDIAAWHRPEHNFYSGNATLHDVEAAKEARAAASGRPGRAIRTAPQNG
jgi:hypothetical protein